MTTEAQAIKLTLVHMVDLFAERDSKKRLDFIASLYVSEGMRLPSSGGVYKSPKAINDLVDKMLAGGSSEDNFEPVGA